MEELMNSRDIVNYGDVVLQKLPCDLYVEIANRYEPITNKVWDQTDIMEFKKQNKRIQIEESVLVIR